MVAIGGTKLAANASRGASRAATQLIEETLAEASTVDAAEDTYAQPTTGLPAELQGRGRKRRERLRELLGELEAEAEVL